MRKQTKLVAVLSAAALLAVGASMTSFAGWEKDEDGIWHYYDSDDEMVEDEWRKDGSKWFYLDEDGNMLTDSWVDDEYYVGSDGAMLKNQWVKTTADEDVSDPEDDGDHWYYFDSKGKKVVDDNKKINGKTYYFNEDGEMLDGWHQDGDGEDVFYLGGEDEGWRAENQWLWLEKPGDADEDNDDEQILDCADEDDCDDEGWYWFGSNGKMYKDTGKKKVNGRYYMFNEHGQMLYEWINNTPTKVTGTPSNAQLDGIATAGSATIENMYYYNIVEEGWRGDGWYEIDGSEDVGTDSDTDWYFFDDGEAEHADVAKDYATHDEDGAVYVAKIKVDSSKGKKYFAFNEKGQMQTGLQYIRDDGGFYYFDENGYMQDGKVSDVECDDDTYGFYFNTNNGKNGQGYTGEKDNYLYFNGKRLEADDDYRLYLVGGDIYLVSDKGKIQYSKSDNKKYDIENEEIESEDVVVTFKGKKVDTVTLPDKTSYTAAELIAKAKENINSKNFDPSEDAIVSIPFIQLYDDDQYTYSVEGDKFVEGWRKLNVPKDNN